MTTAQVTASDNTTNAQVARVMTWAASQLRFERWLAAMEAGLAIDDGEANAVEARRRRRSQ